MKLKQYMKQREKEKNLNGNKVVELYKGKIEQAKSQKLLIISIVSLVLIGVGIIGIQRHVYHEYNVLSSAENEDTQSAKYVQLGGGLLKYGDDGAYLLSQSQSILWNRTFEMTNPYADVRGNRAVVYDKKGTLMYVLSEEGAVGTIETEFLILQAEVTEKGTVAAILEDGEKTWINYYASDGSIIAENQTRMENPGYPLDLAVSPNGEMIAVSYQYIDNGKLCSRLIYYNFGDEGQNKVDNIVREFTYENTIIPQIVYLNDNTSVAFRDNGYSVFEGVGKPEEKIKEDMETEIISTFYDDRYFGMVLKGEDEKEPYVMQIYGPSGRKKCEKGFDAEYQEISLSGDKVIMHNDAEVVMYDLRGVLKFQGTMEEGAVKNLFQIASRQYIMVSENGINTIRLR